MKLLQLKVFSLEGCDCGALLLKARWFQDPRGLNYDIPHCHLYETMNSVMLENIGKKSAAR